MELRVWDLWDNLAGDIERGYGGDSIIWPYAAWDLSRPPERTQLFVAQCNTNDPYQRWAGAALTTPGIASTIVNAGACRGLPHGCHSKPGVRGTLRLLLAQTRRQRLCRGMVARCGKR
jgi:hypothetical protein